MATTWFSNESGTVGASVVVADNAAHPPASDVGYAAKIFTGASLVFVSDAMHGARAVKLSGSASGISYVQVTPTTGWTSRTIAFTVYVKCDTAATQDHIMVYVSAGGSRVMSVNRNAANKIRVQSVDNTNIWTATNTFPLNSYVRIEGYLNIDSASATAGSLNLAIYDGDTNTLLETEQTLTGFNFGTTAAGAVYLMKFDSGTYAGGVTLDSAGINDTATQRLGKFPTTTFAVTGVLTPANPQLYSVQRTLTLTAQGSNGNAITYAVSDWGDGTGGSATQSSNVFTHTYPTMASGAANATYTISASASQAG